MKISMISSLLRSSSDIYEEESSGSIIPINMLSVSDREREREEGNGRDALGDEVARL